MHDQLTPAVLMAREGGSGVWLRTDTQEGVVAQGLRERPEVVVQGVSRIGSVYHPGREPDDWNARQRMRFGVQVAMLDPQGRSSEAANVAER